VSKAEDIMVNVLDRASTRIHWALFINTILCAIVFSNFYSNKYSYEKSLIQSAQFHIIDTEAKLTRIESDYRGDLLIKKPNGKLANLKPERDWSREDLENYSKLISSQSQAYNALREHNLSFAQSPLVSTKISSTDLNVLCGIAMTVLLIWLYLSTTQVTNIITKKEFSQLSSKYYWIIEYIFVTFHSKTAFFRILFSGIILTLPLLTMLITLKDNYETALKIKNDIKFYGILEKSINANIYTLLVINIIIAIFTVCIIIAWSEVLKHCRSKPHIEAG
jgi:hypothetical protein